MMQIQFLHTEWNCYSMRILKMKRIERIFSKLLALNHSKYVISPVLPIKVYVEQTIDVGIICIFYLFIWAAKSLK